MQVVAEQDGGAPRRRFAPDAWLIGKGADLPAPVRLELLRNLYGTLPIYVGGVISTLSVALILAFRIGTPAFYVWVGCELILAVIRFRTMRACHRAIAAGQPGPLGHYAFQSVLWAGSVGFGNFIVIASGDWIAALAACVASAAMLGGICFRYFAAPRFACAMLVAMGLPGAAACFLSGEPVLLIAAVQVPLYIAIMTSAAVQMNRTLVKALCAERDQAHRARHDQLTGLLNRGGFLETVGDLPETTPLACFYVDLDGFKRVNDSLGHRAGDALLEAVATRLRDAAPEGSVLARFGGDEFVIATACACPDRARIHGDTIAAALAGSPYIVEGQGVFIGSSVGAALRLHPHETLDELIAAADAALHDAKAQGRSTCVVSGMPSDEPAEPEPCHLRLAHG